MSVLAKIAARVADWRAEHPRASESRGGISACEEFRRIAALPRRIPETFVKELSAIYAKRDATLLPLQATALYDFLGGGLIGALPVGSGKTLLSFLLCHGYERPLLVLPGALVGKTMREMREYRKDWHLPRRIEIISYEKLARVLSKDFLEEYKPTIIVCDEAHKLKNHRTAAHRRMRRYVTKHKPAFVPLSGTLIGERLMHWAPLSDWALHEGSPAPRKWATQSAWAGALDAGGRTSSGALRVFCATDDETVQEGFGRRVRETPGVLCHSSVDCGASIQIAPVALPLSEDVQMFLDVLHSDWELPSGVLLVDPLTMGRAARQLELGCYYRWVTPAPEEWLIARKGWNTAVRECVKYHRLDTELEVRNWVDAHGDAESRYALEQWRMHGPTFTPVTECIWLDDGPINALVAMAKEAPAIVWVHHREIGLRLDTLGLPYYAAKGLRAGVSIESELGDRSVCASIESNATGRNLQRFARAIIAELPDDPKRVEQLIGRMHRTGQKADEVLIQPVLSTQRARDAMLRTRDRALIIESITGLPMKLTQGDWSDDI